MFTPDKLPRPLPLLGFLRFCVPERKRLVAKLRQIERQIAEAQAATDAAPARKQTILLRYL